MHSDSWGSRYNQYAAASQQVDAFLYANPDFVAVFAAGNTGSDTVVPGGGGTSGSNIGVRHGHVFHTDSSYFQRQTKTTETVVPDVLSGLP